MQNVLNIIILMIYVAQLTHQLYLMLIMRMVIDVVVAQVPWAASPV